MTQLEIIAAVLVGTVVIVGLMVLALWMDARARGRAEGEAVTARDDRARRDQVGEAERKMADAGVSPPTEDEVEKRLRDGSF